MLKYIALFMVLLVFIGMAGIAYVYMNSNVEIVSYDLEAVKASNMVDNFNINKAELKDGTFIGTVFKNSDLEDINNYTYINYKIRLKNNCFVPIDAIEVQLVPRSSDIFQIADLGNKSLSAKTLGDINVSILTEKDTQSIREFVITYYVWGLPFHIRDSYG